MTEENITPATTVSQPSSPTLPIATITTENNGSSTPTQFIVDDAELLSILADPSDNHAEVSNSKARIGTPTVAILDWQDWNQDVPEFPNEDVNNNKKRKRGDTPSESDDDEDEEDEFNFLDQFDFVDATFDHTSASTDNDATSPTTNTKKQKTNTFVNDNVTDLSSLLKQADSLIDDLDYRWVLDITS